MDNIQKMVLGMVAIVAIVVLIMPQGNPLAEKAPTEVAAPENIASVKDEKTEDDGVESPPPPATPPSENTSASAEVTNFGQPMMDPTPAAERAERERREQSREQQMSRQGGQQEGPADEQNSADDDLNTSGPTY